MPRDCRPHIQNIIQIPFWICLLTVFVALRFDTSERTYFQVDDQVVVRLVDDAVNDSNWQPDWYRAVRESGREIDPVSVINYPPHEHHYNFSMHILLSAAIIKPLRAAGIVTPTIVLLHHIALLWDTLSLLLLVLAARQLGGTTLAACAAILYTVFPLAVQGSHYARPDALLTAMGTAALFFSLQKNVLSRWHWLLASGITVGIATGAKASQLMLGGFPALASCATWLDPSRRHWRTIMGIAADGCILLILVAGVIGLMFAAGSISPGDFILSVLNIQNYYQNPGPPDTLEHYSFLAQLFNILRYFYSTLGWPMLLAMIAGTTALARRADRLPVLLLTVPALLFTLYFSSIPAFFDRSFCPLAAAMVLLAANGIHSLARQFTTKRSAAILLALLACWKPAAIQYHLQTGHLRSHFDDGRLAFQQQLKKDWSGKTGSDFWLKNINRLDLYSQTLPERSPKNPRIYIAEDLNDWNSRDYLQKLRDNGFIQIAEFHGDFADMPTNSLITIHQAARFVYYVRQDDLGTSGKQ